MAIVSVTRLRLRSRWYLVPFAWRSLRSARQARRSAGFLAGALGRDADGGFWTLTLWADEASMQAYRAAGAHGRAMPRLLDWCDEAAVAHWEQRSDALPSPEEALEGMRKLGRLSKVRHPSPAHAARTLAPTDPPRLARRLEPAAPRAAGAE